MTRLFLAAVLGGLFAAAALPACFTSFELAADAGASDGSPAKDGSSGDGADGDASVKDEAPPNVGPCKTGSCAPEGLFCDYPDDQCGSGPAPGACTKPIGACDDKRTVCGCDGKLYTGACEANLAGTDVDQAFRCAPPPDAFLCGSSLCSLKAEYCVRKSNGTTDSTSCEAMPAPCVGDPTCTCLMKNSTCTACDVPAGGSGVECIFK